MNFSIVLKSSICLFLATFLMFTIFVPKWGLHTDDYVDLGHVGIVKNIGEVSQFLNHKNVFSFGYQGNGLVSYEEYRQGKAVFQEYSTSFFGTFFRPITYCFLALQNYYFHNNPHSFYRVTVFLHALSVVVFFLILLLLFSLSYAVGGALFFAFHPSLSLWFGLLSLQQHVFELLLTLVTILFLGFFLQKKKGLYLFLSLLFFALVLLSRETLIIFPGLILVAYLIGLVKVKRKEALGFFFSYLGIALGYLSLRFWLHPIDFSDSSAKAPILLHDLLFKTLLNYEAVKTMILDFLGFAVVSGGYKGIKAFVVALVIGSIVFLFIKIQDKKPIFFIGFSIFSLLWPTYILGYESRYSYLVIALVIVALLIMVKNYVETLNYVAKKRVFLGVAVLFALNAATVIVTLNDKGNFLYDYNKAFAAVVNDPALEGKRVYFVGLLNRVMFVGIVPAVFLNNQNPKFTFLFELFFSIDYSRYPLFRNINLASKDFVIERTGPYSVHLEAIRPEVGWFSAPGERKVHTADINSMTLCPQNKQVQSCDFSVKKEFCEGQEIVFVRWDFDSKKFVIF